MESQDSTIKELKSLLKTELKSINFSLRKIPKKNEYEIKSPEGDNFWLHWQDFPNTTCLHQTVGERPPCRERDKNKDIVWKCIAKAMSKLKAKDLIR